MDNKKAKKPPDTAKKHTAKKTLTKANNLTDTIKQPTPARWLIDKQDRNSRTAYTNGLKVQIDSRKNGSTYRGVLNINGPNEAFIVLMEKSGDLATINVESSAILKAIANDLILLAEELRPSHSPKSTPSNSH